MLRSLVFLLSNMRNLRMALAGGNIIRLGFLKGCSGDCVNNWVEKGKNASGEVYSEPTVGIQWRRDGARMVRMIGFGTCFWGRTHRVCWWIGIQGVGWRETQLLYWVIRWWRLVGGWKGGGWVSRVPVLTCQEIEGKNRGMVYRHGEVLGYDPVWNPGFSGNVDTSK